jgi:TRAP-type C4-dicarboxylate transport system permease small subunit
MKSKKVVDSFLKAFVVFIMSILVIDVIWNVIARYINTIDNTYSVELARFLLIWVGLFGSAYATGQKEHVAIELLPQSLAKKNPAKKRKLDVFINVIIALFAFLALVLGGTNLVYITLKLEQVSPAMQIPLGYVYMCLPISGLLIMFYCIHVMIFGYPNNK